MKWLLIGTFVAAFAATLWQMFAQKKSSSILQESRMRQEKSFAMQQELIAKQAESEKSMHKRLEESRAKADRGLEIQEELLAIMQGALDLQKENNKLLQSINKAISERNI